MSRLVIDVTAEQHQQIKALAALKGKSIKHFILEKLFTESNDSEQAALSELTELLQERIQSAETRPLSTKTMSQIAEEHIRKNGKEK